MSDSENACLAKEWFYPFVMPNGQTVPSTHQHQLDLIHVTRTEMLNDFIHQHFQISSQKKLAAIDLACHQGWFSSQLVKLGFENVLATDARDNHIADAQLIFKALDQSEKIRTLQSDVHSLDANLLGQFDLVLCLGLIYHLENPIGALRKAFALCKNACVIETQIAPGQTGVVDYGSYRFVKQIEASFVVIDETHETHGSEASTQGICLIPNLEGLIWILRKIGFSRVDVLPVPADGYEQLLHGKRAMIAAYV
jgi:tRNA (mo5U34)-methyltransferase